jgi:hypothetical protein
MSESIEDRDKAIAAELDRMERLVALRSRPDKLAQLRYDWTSEDLVVLESGGAGAVTKAMELVKRKVDSMFEMGQ